MIFFDLTMNARGVDRLSNNAPIPLELKISNILKIKCWNLVFRTYLPANFLGGCLESFICKYYIKISF